MYNNCLFFNKIKILRDKDIIFVCLKVYLSMSLLFPLILLHHSQNTYTHTCKQEKRITSRKKTKQKHDILRINISNFK